jgi:hypothetical protein
MGVRETLAWKACEWGLFIAAGLHCESGGRCVLGAMLFDPDGDVVAHSAPPGDGKANARGDDNAGGHAIVLWRSSVGTIGVLAPDWAEVVPDSLPASAGGMVMALPLPTSAVRPRTRAAGLDPKTVSSKLCKRPGVFWALVCPACDSDLADGHPALASSLWSPDGVAIAKADGPEEVTVCVDVPVELTAEAL